MDQQAGRVGSDIQTNKVRSAITVVAVVVLTVVYGSITVIFGSVIKQIGRACAKIWAQQLLMIAGIRVTINGLEKIDPKKKYIFISNHQSGLDIPLLMASLPRFISFIAKKELFFIPFLGWGMAAVGHIWIDRSNARKARESILRAVRKIQKEDVSLVLFPEGTRSVTGEVGDFKKGSFTLAIEAGVDLIPLAIRGAALILPKHDKYVRQGTVYLDIGDPISVSGAGRGDKAELAEKVQKIISAMAERDCA